MNMRLSELIKPDAISLNISVKDKRELIEKMVDTLVTAGVVVDKGKMVSDLLDREKVMTTGIGKGIGIPHARSSATNSLAIAFATTAEKIDFDSLDDEPADTFFMIVGDENVGSKHVQVLAKISRLLQRKEFRNALRSATTTEEVIKILNESDNT